MLAEWHDSYSAGIKSIDDYHKRLFNFINELYDRKREPDGGKALDDFFHRLAEHYTIHFADEERLMREHDYPETVAHIRDHDRMKDFVQGFLDNVKAGVSPDPEKALRFLIDWLHHHLGEVDGKLGEYLRSRGVS